MSADLSNKNKKILNSSFTFSILSKLYNGYRPAQIADQLGVTPQAVKYHTDNMIAAGLIRKDKSIGIRWIIEEKGLFILKQKATRSVNSFNNYQTARLIPTRLDNLSFMFRILSPIPDDPHFNWIEMKNSVMKCSLKYDTHTVELVKSEKKGPIMLVHLGKKYCFDWYKELINQYNLAIHCARQVSTQLAIEILDYGMPIKRPHIAFEEDLIANFIATSHTTELKTDNEEQKTWVDSSNGVGELETNHPDYAYLYLMMPKTIEELAVISRRELRYRNAEYEQYYHPYLTKNN